MEKTYCVAIDKKTCRPHLVKNINEADYVFEAESEKDALHTARRIAFQEKAEKIGIFDDSMRETG